MDYKVKDRSAKVATRKARMPKNGIAFRKLLIDRAAKVQRDGLAQNTLPQNGLPPYRMRGE